MANSRGTSRVKQLWQRRWFRLSWVIVGILGPIMWHFWPLIWPGTPLQFVRDSSILDELKAAGAPTEAGYPWNQNGGGYVAYPTSLPTPPTYTPLDNAILKFSSDNAHFKQHFGYTLSDTRGRVDTWRRRFHTRPWSSEDFPGVSATVDQNADWYAIARRNFTAVAPAGLPTSQRRYVSVSDGIYTSRDVTAGINSVIANGFLLKAAQEFGSGDPESGLDDIEFILRIAVRSRFHPWGIGRGMQIEADAIRLLVQWILSSDDPIPVDVVARIQRLQFIPSRELVRRAVGRERFRHLNDVASGSKGFLRSSPVVIHHRDTKGRIASQLCAYEVDWQQIHADTTKYFDELDSRLESEELYKSLQLCRARSATDAANDAAKRIMLEPFWSRNYRSQDIEAIYQQYRSQAPLITSFLLRDLRQQVLQLALHLRAWQESHGEFPDSIHDLPLQESTQQALMRDAFASEALTYRRTKNGFEIRSVYVDGIPGKSAFNDLQPHGTADDVVWRWPVE